MPALELFSQSCLGVVIVHLILLLLFLIVLATLC